MNGFIETERVYLEALRVAVRSTLPDELRARFDRSELSERHVMDIAAMVRELDSYVHAQRLAPAHIDVDFSRPVEVKREEQIRREVPATRRDLLLLALPRWGRWRNPRYKIASASRRLPSSATIVRIQDRVEIERFWTYPDSTYALPEKQWGRPFVSERVIPPWTRS